MHASFTTAIVENQLSTPKDFSLSQNYPNPFNPTAIIQFTVPKQEHVTLIVYNLIGQQVTTLVNDEISAGTHKTTFNAGSLASGIYIYRLIGNSVNITKKMILMK
jgi:hypothetical protein